MDKERWKKLQELFESTLALSADKREEFLTETCGDDTELLNQVQALLSADASDSGGAFEKLSDEASQFFGSLSLEGKTIGNYQISSELGSGGMGVVYLAYDSSLNRQVALKFLPPMLAMDESIRIRFTKEAMAAAALNHPNIVTVHEVSTHGQVPYIAMEYVNGTTLQSRIREGNITVPELYDISLQLCEGLEAAHQAGIIHRDIKPGNLMLDNDGRLRILDFGLAKSLDDHTITRAGSTMGTVEYLSPEQVKGEAPDARSDLFSLGAVLFELATGVTPFKRKTAVGVFQAIVSEAPKSMRSQDMNSRCKKVSPSFERIVQRLLEKNPDNRYQNAGEVISELRIIVDGGTVKFQPGQLVRWASRARFHRSTPWVTAVALIALTVLAIKIPFNDLLSPTPRMAVMQFTNLGSADDQYFVDGFTTEIKARLSRISGIEVVSGGIISSASDTDIDIRSLGQQLDVDYILRGSLLWNKTGGPSDIHVVSRLGAVSENKDVWTESFQEKASELFGIQSAIARSAAQSMGVNVPDDERREFQLRPTNNIEAYNFYLRGLDYYRRGSSWENRLLALEMYQRAIELDSSFSMAYARIGEVHSLMYYANYDHTDKRLALAKTAIDKSLALDSDSPEGHTVLGLYYYWGFRDYQKAEEHFKMALDLRPQDAETHNNISLVMRRQGKWDKAVEHLREAIGLDPLSHQYISNLAGTLTFIRQYAEADTLWNRVMWLSPEWAWSYAQKARLQITWRGDIDSAIAVVKNGMKHSRYETLDLAYVRLLQIAGRYDEAGKALTLSCVLLNETDENRDTAQYFSILAELSLAEGDSVTAANHLDSTEAHLQRIQEKTPLAGYRNKIRMARLYAAQGLKEKTKQAFSEVISHPIVIKDEVARAGIWLAGAEIHALLGDQSAALTYLEKVLSGPGLISAEWINNDPMWAKLRESPRLTEMLKKYGHGA
jgi:serine/threonine protein kinase/Tfp pilus assembly protein PilF